MKRWSMFAAVVVTVCLGACISSSPPGPAVRYFDPSPVAGAAATGTAAARPSSYAWRVTAAAHLGREFAVRTGPRELVFDPLHSWIATPRELVEDALVTSAGVLREAKPAELRITAFDIDLTGAPRAHVHFELVMPGAMRRQVETTAPASANGPEAFAAAMAAALAAAVKEVLVEP